MKDTRGISGAGTVCMKEKLICRPDHLQRTSYIFNFPLITIAIILEILIHASSATKILHSMADGQYCVPVFADCHPSDFYRHTGRYFAAHHQSASAMTDTQENWVPSAEAIPEFLSLPLGCPSSKHCAHAVVLASL